MKLRKKAEEALKILQKAVGTVRILQKGSEKWLTTVEERDQTMPSDELLTYGRKLTVLEISLS